MLDLEEQISNMKIIHVAGTKGKVISFSFVACLLLETEAIMRIFIWFLQSIGTVPIPLFLSFVCT